MDVLCSKEQKNNREVYDHDLFGSIRRTSLKLLATFQISLPICSKKKINCFNWRQLATCVFTCHWTLPFLTVYNPSPVRSFEHVSVWNPLLPRTLFSNNHIALVAIKCSNKPVSWNVNYSHRNWVWWDSMR